MEYKRKAKAKRREIHDHRDSLRVIAKEAGWQEVGAAMQSTRWQLPEAKMGKSIPHTYAQEYDIKRFMRWIATRLSVQYAIKSEIQCYYDASTHRILVAANDSFDMGTLEQHVHTVPLVHFFENVLKVPFPIGFAKTKKEKLNRQKRHGEQLGVLSQIALTNTQENWTQVRFEVVPYDNTELHAEQRILRYLRGQAEVGERAKQLLMADAVAVYKEYGLVMLRPELLGGIKRPCLACTHACFTPYDRVKVNSGLFWDTISATGSLEQVALAELVNAIKIQYKVNRTLAGDQEEGILETEEIDSESEDEDDFCFRLLRKL